MLLAALATTARAEPAAPGAPASGPGAAATDEDRAEASEAPPKVVAAASESPAALDGKSLHALTDDPIVGKASRIEGDERKGLVAFTFDDGPNPETTPAVIDALEKYNIPATFFIVTQRIAGKHGERSREIMQSELADGFLVARHSAPPASLRHAAGPT